MQDALKIVDDTQEKGGRRLVDFLNQKSLKPFIFNENRVGIEPLVCYKGNQKINEYEAMTLFYICNAIFVYEPANV